MVAGGLLTSNVDSTDSKGGWTPDSTGPGDPGAGTSLRRNLSNNEKINIGLVWGAIILFIGALIFSIIYFVKDIWTHHNVHFPLFISHRRPIVVL